MLKRSARIVIKTLSLFFIILLPAMQCGCSTAASGENLKATVTMLDTVVTIELFEGDEELLDKTVSLCGKYNRLFSPDGEGSDIYKINSAVSGEPTKVNRDTAELINKSLEYCEVTNGAFDITAKNLTDLWDFRSGNAELPDVSEIRAALSSVGYKNISVDGNYVTLYGDSKIDVGASAKGFICDKLAAFLIKNGCRNALLNLGGNVYVLGKNKSKSPFTVGIQKPFSDTGESAAYIKNLSDLSVVTCGRYMRYFELDGTVYHHIIDLKTGYPVQNGLDSVTVISKSSVDADCLSTSLFLLGKDEGLKTVENIKDTEAVFISSDGDITFSSGLRSDGAEKPTLRIENLK